MRMDRQFDLVLADGRQCLSVMAIVVHNSLPRDLVVAATMLQPPESHATSNVSKEGVLAEAKRLGLDLPAECVIQDALPMRLVHDTFKMRRTDASLNAGKVATLGSLVIRCAMHEVTEQSSCRSTTDPDSARCKC